MADGHSDPTRFDDQVSDDPQHGDAPLTCSECGHATADDYASDDGPPLCFTCAYFQDGGE